MRKSRSLNDNVFMILDKMEALQNVVSGSVFERSDFLFAAHLTDGQS